MCVPTQHGDQMAPPTQHSTFAGVHSSVMTLTPSCWELLSWLRGILNITNLARPTSKAAGEAELTLDDQHQHGHTLSTLLLKSCVACMTKAKARTASEPRTDMLVSPAARRLAVGQMITKVHFHVGFRLAVMSTLAWSTYRPAATNRDRCRRPEFVAGFQHPFRCTLRHLVQPSGRTRGCFEQPHMCDVFADKTQGILYSEGFGFHQPPQPAAVDVMRKSSHLQLLTIDHETVLNISVLGLSICPNSWGQTRQSVAEIDFVQMRLIQGRVVAQDLAAFGHPSQDALDVDAEDSRLRTVKQLVAWIVF
ncbi:hypothetical protein MKZ38_008863 [Zalerion maritima]|uniref:Uncharacterized protein n=1 Tax=Zalerion maritima TaxID=339359 RepID=A0AAD5RGD5_9PEZI|nr:hypothetical protein MKZ38_008863 [Zalerion maritima]